MCACTTQTPTNARKHKRTEESKREERSTPVNRRRPQENDEGNETKREQNTRKQNKKQSEKEGEGGRGGWRDRGHRPNEYLLKIIQRIIAL